MANRPLRGPPAQVLSGAARCSAAALGPRFPLRNTLGDRPVSFLRSVTLQFASSPGAPAPVARSGLFRYTLGTMTDVADIRARLKRVIVDSLMLEGMSPEDIGDDEPLFGEGLGLDSVDALELVLGIEQEFGLKIGNDEMDRSAFSTVASLGDFVLKIRSAQAAGA